MKLTNRILSLILATVVILSCFASCDLIGGKPEDAIADAEEALASAPYVATTSLTFTTDDEDMKSAVSALGDTVVKLSVNGENLAVSTKLSTTNTTLELDCTVYDGVVYRRDYLKVGNEDATTKKRSPITDVEKGSIATSAAPGSEITYVDFSDVTLEKTDNVSVISCTNLKAESLGSMKTILSERLGIDATAISISDVEYAVKIVDGKYESASLSCNYGVIIAGVMYDLGLQATTSYDYSSDVVISTPADASEYELASLEEIIDL